MSRSVTLLAAATLMWATAAAAQTGTAPSGGVGSTVGGGLPETAGSTTAVGQTKPPGDALGSRMGTSPELEQESREIDKKINTGICSGCK